MKKQIKKRHGFYTTMNEMVRDRIIADIKEYINKHSPDQINFTHEYIIYRVIDENYNDCINALHNNLAFVYSDVSDETYEVNLTDLSTEQLLGILKILEEGKFEID